MLKSKEIQILTCGTRGLNQDEFDLVAGAVQKCVQGTIFEGHEITYAYCDWGREPQFRGFIHIGTNAGENFREWYALTHGIETSSRAALRGTELERVEIHAINGGVQASPYRNVVPPVRTGYGPGDGPLIMPGPGQW